MVKSLSYLHMVCSLTGDIDKRRGYYKTLYVEREVQRRGTKQDAGFWKEHDILAEI